jgi:hypothetical protein
MSSGPRSSINEGPPDREIDILRRAITHIQDRVPSSWSISPVPEPPRDRRIDAIVDVTGPDRRKAVLLVKARRSLVTRELPALVEELNSYASHMDGAAAPLIVARHVGSSARKWLEEHDISYADSTGNVYVSVKRPALFLRDRGADRDPWRGPGRPRGTLQGRPAARVVRALVDFTPPVSLPELVRRSGASTGATYRVIEFLEREDLVERSQRGPVHAVQWRRIIERWSEDYGFQRSNAINGYVQPRGLPTLLEGLAAAPDLRYALTGSFAALRFAPYAAPRLAMIHVDRPEQFAEQLGLRAVDSGANVLLATGDYDVAFDRTIEVGGVRYAAPSQTAVDLLTGPGRSPAEGEALLDWMEAHEPDWRR